MVESSEFSDVQTALFKEREDMRLLKNEFRNQKAEYDAIFQNLADAYIMMDLSGRVNKMSDKAKEMLGYDISKEKFNLRQLVIPSDVDKVQPLFASFLEKGVLTNFRTYIKTKDNQIKYVQTNASIIYDENKNAIAAQGIVRDITELHKKHTALKKLEFQKGELLKELEKSNTELQDYAHMVSHDLKAPLRNIDTLTAWFKEDYKEKIDTEGVKTLDTIRTNVEKMEDLIKGILVYSSVTFEEVEMYDIDLNKLIEEAISILHIPQNVAVKINKKLPIVKGDKFRFLQLFQNLIHNGIIYNDKPNAIIDINFEDAGRYWKFCVEDNGNGLEGKYLEKIFDVFQKLDSDMNSSGIGLSIVKKIVEVYGGTICAESELDVGTKIIFTLKKF